MNIVFAAIKKLKDALISKPTDPEVWIQKTFLAYLSILKETQTILQEEQISSISNQVLQWFSFVQSYVNSKCSSEERHGVDWPKIERRIVVVNFSFLISFLQLF